MQNLNNSNKKRTKGQSRPLGREVSLATLRPQAAPNILKKSSCPAARTGVEGQSPHLRRKPRTNLLDILVLIDTEQGQTQKTVYRFQRKKGRAKPKRASE